MCIRDSLRTQQSDRLKIAAAQDDTRFTCELSVVKSVQNVGLYRDVKVGVAPREGIDSGLTRVTYVEDINADLF